MFSYHFNLFLDFLSSLFFNFTTSIFHDDVLFCLQELWEEVEKYPLFGHLKNKSHYIITAIKSPSARKEEIADEDQRICDVQPFFGLFKIAEKKELSEDNKLNESITNLIGKTYSEFNKTLKNAEVRKKQHHMTHKNKHHILYNTAERKFTAKQNLSHAKKKNKNNLNLCCFLR